MSGPSQVAVPIAAGQDTAAQVSVRPEIDSTVPRVAPEIIRTQPCDRKEWLYSNLLKFSYFPTSIYIADTPHRLPGTVWEALRRAGGEVGPEWVLSSKQIFTFRNLHEPPWNGICDQNTIRQIATEEWSETDDPDRRSNFVYLLHQCLGGMTSLLGLWYSRRLDCYFFPATFNLLPRVLTYKSIQKETKRTVFEAYRKKNDPDKVGYCRHSAFQGAIQRYDQEWFLEITPTYYFTSDGERLSRYQGSLLAGIKRFERHAAVVGQLIMWAFYLTQPEDLFHPKYPYLQFGKLERFEVNRGIDDASWMSQDGSPPEGEEDTNGYLTFPEEP